MSDKDMNDVWQAGFDAGHAEGLKDAAERRNPAGPVHLTIQVVSVSNDTTDKLGFDLYALAAIAYERPHQGIHFIVSMRPDEREAADWVLRDQINLSDFPYEIVET